VADKAGRLPSPAGRKSFEPVMMFKVLILQALYNLSDDAMEYQIRDRLSFQRFLGLDFNDTVPDAKTIWLFREQLVRANLVKVLFDRFDARLRQMGLSARKGQIVDATIVRVPVQKFTKEETEILAGGKVPEWSPQKKRQKDTEARWTRKNGRSFFGYKDHVEVDADLKIIRKYEITPASTHDSQVFEEILDPTNTNRDVFADSAYRSEEHEKMLAREGYRGHVQRKGQRNHPLTRWEKRGNRTRSKIRSRVEHIFGAQYKKAANLMVRSIGLARAKAALGLRNLAYNISRSVFLLTKVFVTA
jgi:IS5 family transposase